MSVPDRIEAARLLDSLTPPAWHLRHSRGVAEVAAWLAERAAAHAGTHPVAAPVRVDRSLVEAAALLHDIDKLLPAEHPVRRLPHGIAGAEWLAERGLDRLAPAVADHPVTRLGDDAFWERWQHEANLEAMIVAYADKRVAQRLAPMAARFGDWERRYPSAGERARAGAWSREAASRVRERAAELEWQVTSAAGVRPRDVRRLRWTANALEQARATSR